MTPHLLVNAESDRVQVPVQYIHEGRIVLNINPSAIHHLQLGNDAIEFSARFGGVAYTIHIPPAAVLAIYARENGQGMAFAAEKSEKNEKNGKNSGTAKNKTVNPVQDSENNGDNSKPPPGAPKSRKKPALKIVK